MSEGAPWPLGSVGYKQNGQIRKALMDALDRAFSEGDQRGAITDRAREPVFGTKTGERQARQVFNRENLARLPSEI